MAARERYDITVTCPKCTQQGVFELSEDDHPYIRNPHRAVEKIDGDFTAEVENGRSLLVRCTACGTRFKAL